MKLQPHEVQAFLDMVTDARKELLLTLRAKILELYPKAEARISYQVLMFHCPTGRLWIGYHKKGVSLYTGFPSLIADFHSKHPDIKAGKGCINFNLDTKIPWDDVSSLIKYAMEYKALH